MKDKIIDQIIKNLIPLHTLYKEIDTITNDLLMNKFESLEIFLDKEFKDINYSTELKELITYLKENNILPINYFNTNEETFTTKLSQIDKYNYNKSLLIGFKPLNVKLTHLKNIKNNVKNGVNIESVIFFNENEINLELDSLSSFEEYQIEENKTTKDDNLKKVENHESYNQINLDNQEKPKLTKFEINEQDSDEEEILSLEDSQIEKLRKIILNAQLNYLNNANSFIEELEKKENTELYQTLLSLNDIRYIHHSITKLSISTLNRLLIYVEELLEENKHNSINIFIEEAIKKILHDKQKKM